MAHTPGLKSLFWKTTAYYAAAIILLIVLITQAPQLAEYLPVGAAARLFTPPTGASLSEAIDNTAPVLQFDGLRDGGLWDDLAFIVLCFLSAVLVVIPLAHIYLGTPSKKKPQMAIARSIILLPVAVTGLVLIVQNSLALAFSLAGMIAGAGIRFRTQVRTVSDTLYFLIAIGIGLASGVGALGIALITSVIFCYTTLAMQAVGFGEGQVASENEGQPAPDASSES